MGAAMDLLDLPAYFDPIERLTGMVSTFLYADWKRSYRRAGWLGVMGEFAACLTSHNAPTFYIARSSSWRGIDIERLLKRHGVKIWDRGLAGDHLYFCVKRRQARWAEYLLLRAGVPLTNAPADPRNQFYASRYSPGSEPPTRTPKSNGDWLDWLHSLLD
jgi:hypothetical protein